MICLMGVLMRSILYIHRCCFPAGHSWQMKPKLFNSIWNLTAKIPFLLDFGRLLQMMAESVLNNRSMWRRFSGRSLAEASLGALEILFFAKSVYGWRTSRGRRKDAGGEEKNVAMSFWRTSEGWEICFSLRGQMCLHMLSCGIQMRQ